MKSTFIKRFKKLIIFFPILIYLGKRSYLAYDEGFYALQARWIIDNNNWLIPQWWDGYNLDRTIGIQYLIAKSQTIFGMNSFAAHIPTTIGAFVMIFLTHKLHEELVGKRGAIFSSIILSTTFIWFDFAHQATQDLIFACLVTGGLYSLIKIESNRNILFHLTFGLWIGLAFILKTFLVIVPLIALSPYILKKRNVIVNNYFVLGLFIGFLPFIIWYLAINQFLEKNIIFYLVSKFNNLSNQNTFSNPFYYYLWNIPLNFLPWSIFSLIGLIVNFKINKQNNFILCYFPIILLFLISTFSTKTPYYPLQIASIFSINAFIGIQYIINSNRFKPTFIFLISKVIPLLFLSFIFSYYFRIKDLIALSFHEELMIMSGLFLFASSLILISKVNDPKRILILLVLGPYLFSSLLIQSGLFTDRSKELRQSMERLIALEDLKNQVIYVKKSDIVDNASQSKIIRIALLTPNLGKGINKLNEVEPLRYIWTTKSTFQDVDRKSFELIYEDNYLNPWILVKKIKKKIDPSDKIN